MSDYIKREDAMVAYANHEVDIRQGKFDDYHQYMRNVLRSVESADVAPVRHGHWIKISPAGIYECSECQKNVMTSDIEVYEYCHGCGAKMDGENNE